MESQRFAEPQAAGERYRDESFQRVALRRSEQLPGLIGRERLDLVALYARDLDQRRDIPAHDAPSERLPNADRRMARAYWQDRGLRPAFCIVFNHTWTCCGASF